MRVDIHDVGHGACAVVTCPGGARVMLDCGYRLDPGWFPSVAYAGTHVAVLAFTNLDEDHVADLPHVLSNIGLGALFSNPTVTPAASALMKRDGGMGAGVTAAHRILSNSGPGAVAFPVELGEVRVRFFWNRYGLDFTATNNLSGATFVQSRSFAILFAGDLETAGWRALLRLPNFVRELASVRVMVASHHRRANGRSEELFTVMRPDVVVFSDDAKRYESQEADGWYRARVIGIPDLDTPSYPIGYRHRHVLTTRRDGTLTLRVDAGGNYLVTPAVRKPEPGLLEFLAGGVA